MREDMFVPARAPRLLRGGNVRRISCWGRWKGGRRDESSKLGEEVRKDGSDSEFTVLFFFPSSPLVVPPAVFSTSLWFWNGDPPWWDAAAFVCVNGPGVCLSPACVWVCVCEDHQVKCWCLANRTASLERTHTVRPAVTDVSSVSTWIDPWGLQHISCIQLHFFPTSLRTNLDLCSLPPKNSFFTF